MNQKVSTATKKALKHLTQEVQTLRSFFISLAGQDKEGNYRAEFVRDILEASAEIPNYSFKGKQSFLDQLRRV